MTTFDGSLRRLWSTFLRSPRASSQAAPESRNEVNRKLAKMFPFLADGHLTPFQRMVVKGPKVTTCAGDIPLHAWVVANAWNRYMYPRAQLYRY